MNGDLAACLEVVGWGAVGRGGNIVWYCSFLPFSLKAIQGQVAEGSGVWCESWAGEREDRVLREREDCWVIRLLIGLLACLCH